MVRDITQDTIQNNQLFIIILIAVLQYLRACTVMPHAFRPVLNIEILMADISDRY